MTKDLTHDFDVGSRIDRSTRVTVPKRMGPEHFRCNTRQTFGTREKLTPSAFQELTQAVG